MKLPKDSLIVKLLGESTKIFPNGLLNAKFKDHEIDSSRITDGIDQIVNKFVGSIEITKRTHHEYSMHVVQNNVSYLKREFVSTQSYAA